MTISSDLKFGEPISVWLLFILGVAALLFFVLTYRIQLSVPPRVRRWLTALRLAAVAILLFCLLQPFIRQYFSESQRNHVAILLDRSQSMTIPDEAERGRFDVAREQVFERPRQVVLRVRKVTGESVPAVVKRHTHRLLRHRSTRASKTAIRSHETERPRILALPYRTRCRPKESRTVSKGALNSSVVFHFFLLVRDALFVLRRADPEASIFAEGASEFGIAHRRARTEDTER